MMQSTVTFVDDLSIFLADDQELGDSEIQVDYDELTLTLAKEPSNALRNATFSDRFGSLEMEATGIEDDTSCIERKVSINSTAFSVAR